MNDKIANTHLTRSAIVYVRQSSMTQVRNNHESRRLQYAMKTKLTTLGWPEERVKVIDDDLGVTASGAAHRKGFEQMAARVALGGVGVIAARELSRLARNSTDWQRLFELCRQSDTLLLENEAVYNLRNANDRLLLGIKGGISSYELDLILSRASDGKKEKARRGELVIGVPVGFVKTRDGRIEITPESRVREAVALVFTKFFELGSAGRVTRWFAEEDLTLPAQMPGCCDGGRIRWVEARRGNVIQILTNPVYAGAYVHGRGRRLPGGYGGRSRYIRSRESNDWEVLIKDHHAGYIEFDGYEKICAMLEHNRQAYASAHGAGGAAKNGTGLLSGLIRCGHCGRMMRVSYASRNRMVRYSCFRGDGNALPKCPFSFGGREPEEMVVRALFEALKPTVMEAAEQAYLEEHSAVDERERALALESDQMRYEAERAERQYDAIEPENRMVAAELERRWNVALERSAAAAARLEEHRGRLRRERRSREEFLSMAEGFEAVWNASEADVSLKKRILRTAIKEIVADGSQDGREIVLRVHWSGGIHTEYTHHRRPTGQTHRSHCVEAVTAIVELSSICEDRMIAKYLNENKTLRYDGQAWTPQMVKNVRVKRGICQYDPERRRAEGLMTLNEAAHHLGVSHDALQGMASRDEVPYRRPLPVGPYIFRQSDLAGHRGDALRAAVKARTKRKKQETPVNGGLFD